jgi:hypothetical protein
MLLGLFRLEVSDRPSCLGLGEGLESFNFLLFVKSTFGDGGRPKVPAPLGVLRPVPTVGVLLLLVVVLIKN